MRRFAAVLAVSIAVFGTSWAQASLTTVRVQAGDYVEMSAGSRQYVMNGETGGEFGMTVYDGAMNLLGTFYTFCADPTTFMYYNQLYKVDAVVMQTNWATNSATTASGFTTSMPRIIAAP